jgi:hypothetical protein
MTLQQALNDCFIKVVDGEVVGKPFTLPENYITDTGEVVMNVRLLTFPEKRRYGLYPVTQYVTAYNEEIQQSTPLYTIRKTSVELRYEITNISLDDLRSRAATAIYGRCAATLNAQAVGYSVVEIASFPIIQAEIRRYKLTGNLGPAMQAVIQRGRHTAETLCALLEPKIRIQEWALATRDADIEYIQSCAEPQLICKYF